MCGIAGIFSFGQRNAESEIAELHSASDCIRSRGPDDSGEWSSADGRLSLAHRRLAIIDLDPRGAQPMLSTGGRQVLVFNGEIYNFRELRKELVQEGYAFQTETDSEVLLALYSKRGPDLQQHLEGMYAYALWDEEKQELHLGRDPFGIKPLYLSRRAGKFYFASQVKALLQFSAIDRTLDSLARLSYFTMGSVPEPKTLFRSIVQLEAGASLVVSSQGGEVKTERSIARFFGGKARNSAAKALEESVAAQLYSDAPAGIFLSAGIDSNLLLSLASRVREQAIQTVTLGFDVLKGSAGDESALAEMSASHFGSDHQTVWIGKSEFLENLSEFWEAMDQPSIDGLNSYLISGAARRAGLSVALSGLGADELLRGYPSFGDIPRLLTLGRALPGRGGALLGRMARKLLHPLIARLSSPKYASLLEYADSLTRAYILRRALFLPWEFSKSLEQIEEGVEGSTEELVTDCLSWSISQLELSQYMRNQLLRDTDWASMAHSVEVRVPFLNTEFVQAVFAEQNAARPLEKSDILRDTRAGLPEQIVNRSKTGFVVPVRDWLLEIKPELGSERGLRGWSKVVYGEYLRSCGIDGIEGDDVYLTGS